MQSALYAVMDRAKVLQRDELLATADEILGQVGGADGWQLHTVETWVEFQRLGQRPGPAQGWKIHLSATPLSALAVLRAVLPILLAHECAFKMIRSTRALSHLNDAHSPRASAGKFITVYPASDEEARRIAAGCDAATRGLAGPAILSDRYRTDSVVHYRYGAFTRRIAYDSEGRIVHVIHDPDGRAVPDVRAAWFAPPAWTSDPFAADGGEAGESPAPESVLLNGCYQVTQALRHANRGGVYMATHVQTGEEVIIKEARPHVATDRFGRDVRSRLQAEAVNLERLKSVGIAPNALALFEQGEHHFLAIEKLPGTTLRQWRAQTPYELRPAELFEVGRAVAALLETCHAQHLIIRDFNPNNIIILPDGGTRVIDVELACLEGETRPVGAGAFTAGYASPQQMRGETPCRADDELSLAATLFFLATGRGPWLPEDSLPGRSLGERLTEQLDGMLMGRLIPREIVTPIVSGLSERPEERWSAARVHAHLTDAAEIWRSSGSTPSPRRGTPCSSRTSQSTSSAPSSD